MPIVLAKSTQDACLHTNFDDWSRIVTRSSMEVLLVSFRDLFSDPTFRSRITLISSPPFHIQFSSIFKPELEPYMPGFDAWTAKARTHRRDADLAAVLR